MEQKDFLYVKTLLRSVLISSSRNMTISQILKDYSHLEGETIPYKQLGFKTIYELLISMDDVLKIPKFPDMNSFVTVIVNDKTEHIRNLVVNQKNKKKRFRKNFKRNCDNSPNSKMNYNYGKCQFNYNKNGYNSTTFKYNTHQTNAKAYRSNGYNYKYKVCGYDYIKNNLLETPKTVGFVTAELQKCVEDLCINSQFTSVNSLKYCLLNHPDYRKLQKSNVNEAMNMLKYFIYIAYGGVYLKDSEFEIFPSNDSKAKTGLKPRSVKELNICDEITEFSFSEDVDNSFGFNNLSSEYDCVSTNGVNDLNKPSNDMDKNFCDHQLKNSEINQNKLKKFVDSTAKPSNNMKIEIGFNKVQKDEHLTSKLMKNGDIDYKNALVSLIKIYKKPITVKQVLDCFQLTYGYSFPFKKFACLTCMDFFRLYPALFKLDNPYSTNSIVSIENQILPERKSTIRKHFMSASIFNNNFTNDNSKNIQLILNEEARNTEFNQNDRQQSIDENAQCETPIEPCNEISIMDYIKIPDSVKKNINAILVKHENGILCNHFMDIYEKEYDYFTFTSYGCKSMSDMAFKLPSVFFVKTNEETSENILFDACRRNELEENLNDPSQHYKNIPKTILFNLSMFFDKYRSGISLNELRKLYCKEYGQCYEPLKYRYSSERHMFESLDKMVKIHDDKLYTSDPFAYIYFIENLETHFNHKESLPISPSCYNQLNDRNVCDETFVYDQIQLNYNKKFIDVLIAEMYNPNSFYIHIFSNIKMLDSLMNDLQNFYAINEDKYKIILQLLTPGLTCTSYSENFNLWYRAKILEIIDENHVKCLYVDFGSIEVLHVSKLRLLHFQFGSLPMQALHCSLYGCMEFTNNYVKVNYRFAREVEKKTLKAQFENLTPNEATGKLLVTLFFQIESDLININNILIDKIKNCSSPTYQTQLSIRRTLTYLEKNESNH